MSRYALCAHARSSAALLIASDRSLRPVLFVQALCATVTDPHSGRIMTVSTTAPGIQLYTANWLGGTPGKGGVTYVKHGALCLETQNFPDAPNHPNFPSAVLRPGQNYRNLAVHTFSVTK
jgi:aldose 1-epimerase